MRFSVSTVLRFVKQFDAPEPGVYEKGGLVIGEETADLAGLTIDGFTPMCPLGSPMVRAAAVRCQIW